MRRWSMVLLVVLMMLSACSGEDVTPAPDTATPTEVFEQYRSALIADDGQAALALMDSDTIAWYDRVVEEALTMPREELEALGYTEMFTILRVRQVFRRYEIEAMTGESLFVDMIDRGWTARSSVEGVRVAEEHVEGNRAWVSFQAAPTEPAMYFDLEDGEWKIALSESFPLADEQFNQAMEGQEYIIETYVLEMLMTLTGLDVDEAIFDGPLD
ncbi:MAG: hypothetical protein JXD18_12700 [Anaerolineae bacterium]|nr:hypothetical protein [Anaerolineae bacterium]